MGSFPNSYMIDTSFQMFAQTVSAWRQYFFERHHNRHYDAVSFILLGKLRYMQNPVKICKIENIPLFKYFDHKYHFIKDY
jgi:hypothetical protein